MARGKKINYSIDGAAPSRDDWNLLGQQAAQSEDNAVSVIMHMPPYAGSRKRFAIGADVAALVVPGAAVGTVNIKPSTLMIGPADTTANVGVSAAGPAGTVAIANGLGGGIKRFDLVYATVMVDALDAAVFQKRKDTTTTAVSVVSTSTTTSNHVTYGVVQGVGAATNPTPPSLPADPAGGFNVPLAYVWVNYLFNAATDPVATSSISEVAPILDVPGAARPLNAVSQFSTQGGITGLEPATDATWKFFLPAIMSGTTDRFIVFDAGNVASGTIIDDTIDWRKRYFVGFGQAKTNSTVPAAGGGAFPTASTPGFVLMGQSFTNDNTFGASRITACRIDSGYITFLGANWIELTVDGSGRLVLNKSGSFGALFMIWLRATAQFSNTHF